MKLHYESWQEMFNGQFLSVRSGRQGFSGDIGQGLITISVPGTDNRFHDIDTYLTPSRQGSVELAPMDGTRLYLIPSEAPQPPDASITPIPNIAFVFDLTTRQWANP